MPKTVTSTDGQITDGIRMHRAGHCSTRTCYDLAGKVARLWAAQCCQVYGIEACAGRNWPPGCVL